MSGHPFRDPTPAEEQDMTAWQELRSEQDELRTMLSELLAVCKRSMCHLTEEDEEQWRRSQDHPEAPYHYLYAAIVKAEEEYNREM